MTKKRNDASRFYPVSCSRSVREQRYIRAKLDLWNQLPREEREAIRDLIDSISEGGVERVALTAVVIRGVSPKTSAQRNRLSERRVYSMWREFLERVKLWG
ncbi:MAG: hypothetical protein IKM82_00970 [Oscillospiraceae bacterium]|nr:hypothetical protein [Oscillospiraceae bacterium]